MKHALVICAALISLHAAAIAQDKSTKRAERRAAMTELRSDLRTWFEREVYATAKSWHEQYDASLPAEDLRTLQGLRQEAKRLKESVANDLQNMRGTFERGNRSELRDKMSDLREKHRDAVKDVLERLKPIAKRSRTKLRQLFDDNEDKIESWRGQARDIVGDWRDEHEDLDFNGMFGRGGQQLPLMGGDGRKAAIRFILWDGTMPPAPEAGIFTPQRMPMSVSPAPSGSAATVDVANVPDGQHALQVFDMNGRLVRTVNVTAQSGKVNHRFDLSGLPAGTYMVSINTPAGRSTTNVVVTK
jgi:hypothetical protein